MSNRTNIATPENFDRPGFEKEVDVIARAQLKVKKLTADRDIKSQKILDEYNERIRSEESLIESVQSKILAFAVKFRDRLFGKGQSTTSNLAKYGFKKGNAKLVNISRYSDDVLAKTLYDDGRFDCVKVTYKLNATGIKAALKNPGDDLHDSFKIDAAERFFVEAKADKEVEI